jgi:Domain of unknown function (DUF227).
MDNAIRHAIEKIFGNNIVVTDTKESNTAITTKVTIELTDTVKHLFIKSSKPSSSYHNMALREAEFYQLINNVSDVIPYCHEAYVNGNDYRIILDDITETHTNTPNLDDEFTWLSCAESLAIFHAISWNQIPDEDMNVEQSLKDSEINLRDFLNYAGDRFDSETVTIYHKAFQYHAECLRELEHRRKSKHNLTIINGDSHIYNFILPKSSGNPMIIDFQFWGSGIGAGDLAHLTRVAFPDKFKNSLHRKIVERYHQTLMRYGITDYTLDECISDYRMNVASMLLIPMWQYTAFGLNYDEWCGDIDGLLKNFIYVTEVL